MEEAVNLLNSKLETFNYFFKISTLILSLIFIIYPVSWFVTFLVISSTYLFWQSRKKFSVDSITLAYFVFLFFIFLSIVVNQGTALENNLVLFSKIIMTSFILLFLYIVIDNKKKFLHMQYLFLLIGFIFVTAGYIEVLFFEKSKSYFLLLKGLPTSASYLAYAGMPTSSPRLLSFTRSVDSNYVGFLIALFYSIVLSITFEKMARQENFFKFLLLSIYFFVAIILTGSRGGILIALGAAFISFSIRYYKNKFMIKKFVLYVIFPLMLCFAVAIIITPENVLFHKINRVFYPSYLETKGSDMIRISLIKAAVDMIKTNPFLGVGLGNFTQSIPTTYPELIEYKFYESHSFIFTLGTVGGLSAIAIFTFIFYKSAKNIISFSTKTNKDDYFFSTICTAYLSTFFVSLPLEYSLTDTYRVMLLHIFIFIMSLTNRELK